MHCSWSISSSNILDLGKISKNIVPFRWIISKKDCVISVVDVGEMEVPTSTPKPPEQCCMSQSIAQQKNAGASIQP